MRSRSAIGRVPARTTASATIGASEPSVLVDFGFEFPDPAHRCRRGCGKGRSLNQICNPAEQVVVAISGGLGNQMFQYAMARRYASANAAELLLYLGKRYQPGKSRQYGLAKFRIAGRLVTHAEAGGLRRVRRWRRLAGRLFRRCCRLRIRKS
jgi:hypothetical protein